MNNSALSLILTLLIISSILTGTVLVGDIIIRHSRTVKGTEISEIAYFAAETAVEKAAYQVLKNYADIFTCAISGTFSGTASYSLSSISITASANPWPVTLSAGQSFQLDLDINTSDTTPRYPTGLVITKGSQPSDLIVYECSTSVGSAVCTSGGAPRTPGTCTQNFSVEFGNPITISAPTNYYKIRINNNGTANETYTLTPSGGSNTLPTGIDISATGTYSDYERKLKTNFPKWQIFGS